MRMINRGIEPQAFNRAQRAERANQQKQASNDGMKDLEDAYTTKKKGSAKPMQDSDKK